MISKIHQFVFLHVPKTGGNSIQEQIGRFSEDELVVGDGQDGVDRFGVKGPDTPRKHAALADYAERVDISSYRIAMGCREPYARALSFYFSPHRWLQRNDDDSRAPVRPVWDREVFLAILPQLRPMIEFVFPLSAPDMLIRYKYLNEDFDVSTHTVGLPKLVLKRRIGSDVAPQILQHAQADDEARDAVRARYASDYEAFGYRV